jgi:hypothetical protein
MYIDGVPFKDIYSAASKLTHYKVKPGSVRYHIYNHLSPKVLKKREALESQRATNARNGVRLKLHADKCHNPKPNKDGIKNQQIIDEAIGVKDIESEDEHKKLNRRIKHKQKDLDIIGEMTWLLDKQRERVKRAEEHEEAAEVLLTAAGKAMSDYQTSLFRMHEVTKGMTSLKEIRMAEMAQMFMGVMARHDVSDSTRFDMFRVLKGFETHDPDYSLVVKNDKELSEFESRSEDNVNKTNKDNVNNIETARDNGPVEELIEVKICAEKKSKP